MGEPGDVLSIVIPALNEEDALGNTVRRCLDARVGLLEDGLRDVEVIVVSDGSTDRTEEIARSFPDVTVLAFDRNRGYGSAIKTGFEHGRGSLLAFLDADGTCDPNVFRPLCRAVRADGASIAVGSRMGAGSEMPRLRRIGNWLFAWLLGSLSATPVGDTASGMRVIRRDALPHLYPLPDGLHFTPAMSARALLEEKLKLVEVPMPYAERVGRSKLSVLRDGIRFLQTILRAALAYRPDRLLVPLAATTAVVAALVALLPIAYYLRVTRVEEWMIYRVLLASLLVDVSMLLACTAIVADRIAAMAHRRGPVRKGLLGAFGWTFAPRPLFSGVAAALVVSVALVWPGIVQYVTTAHVYMHWSRAASAALLLGLAAMEITTAFLLDLLGLIEEQRLGGAPAQPPDRVRAAAGPSRP